MIPYAIFAGTIRYKGGKTLQIQAEELSTSGFTFRLSADRQLHIEAIETVDLTWFCMETYGYQRVELSGWCIENCTEPALRGTQEYRLKTEDPVYQKAVDTLTTEYLRYVRLKTEESEAGLMEALTGIPDTEPYGGTWKEQKAGWMQAIRPKRELVYTQVESDAAKNNETHTLPEFAISLSSRELVQKYLELPAEEFLKYYWETNTLTGHPLTKLHLTHLYIGDAYCALRYPEETVLEKLLDKMAAEDLRPVITLAPMAESDISLFEERIKFLISIQKLHSATIEVVVNDIGTIGLLREICVSKSQNGALMITVGPLLTKRRKDARLGRKPGRQQVTDANRTAAVDNPLYRTWLQEQGVKRFTYESCGYEISLGDNSILELPLYSMNVGTFCPLYAHCQNGSRGRQQKVETCPGYCEEVAFVYPDDRRMVGIGNAIRGFDGRILEDSAYVSALIAQNPGRIVVNFV